MAKVCETGLPGKSKENPLYDWDNWLDGQVWELEKGKDFTVGVTSFRSLASKTAGRRGIKVKTRVKDGNLFIQAKKEVE
jgi:hypothetical protein